MEGPYDAPENAEAAGRKNSIYSDGVSLLLRRDRVDKKSEEATFVSTDSVSLTGSVKFDVLDKKDLILCGGLEMSGTNGFIGESEITSAPCFLKGKHGSSPELSPPTIEVYVAGCFSGKPIIFTKTLQLSRRKKHNRKGMLDAIPEYESIDCLKDMLPSPGLDMKVAEYRSYKHGNGEDYKNIYRRGTECIDGKDGELSWYNAGIRVGLGVCLGAGIGVGLLVRTYQTATRNFKQRPFI
ncbi:hypothetical protein like AT1G75180 [Hibiscus trionum]|uniref:Erythronate-4-phosphate dehydrogenase family protein n=1 Tax=Hibiscus trionum TaxID=183268 RepID=A0A9W7I621_HIBTR|nr:hypothetical protein like AT1G75180 [Hibiscus trionum]